MTQRIVSVFILSALVGVLVLPAQDLPHNVARSLFADQKAYRPGDVVTVLVVETSSASNDAKTTASRDGEISFSGSAKYSTKPLPEVGLSIGSGNTFKGEGGTASRGSVRAKISARVDTLYPNGNLYINGSRLIVINGEEQLLKISGVVRPSDILADNSVYSFNIAEATIILEGSGVINRSQEPGWLTKLFHWLF